MRLNQLWSWLPAFRAVAETEHLHQAAAMLHLTPSTLSRAIKLLEDDIGCALFRRVGRSMELTDSGRTLLGSLRDAMRGLDDALCAITRKPTALLRVAAEESVALVIASTLVGLEPAPTLITIKDEASAQLLRGEVDVLFVTAVRPAGDLLIDRIGELRYSQYCAPGARGNQFIDAPGLPWPPERARAIGLRVEGVALAVAACADGAGFAVLPDMLASGLDRVDEPELAFCQPVYAVRRRPLARNLAVEAAIASVRVRLEQSIAEHETNQAAPKPESLPRESSAQARRAPPCNSTP